MPSRVSDGLTRDVDCSPPQHHPNRLKLQNIAISESRSTPRHLANSPAGHHEPLASSPPERRRNTSISTVTLPLSLPLDAFNLSNDSKRPRPLSSPSFAHNSSNPVSPPTGSYFTPQPGSSGIEPRSPENKRPPASRSSHGIETSTGPPPALSTQRSYLTDNSWKLSRTTDPKIQSSKLTHRALAALGIGNRANTPSLIDSVVRFTQATTNNISDVSPTNGIGEASDTPESGMLSMAIERRRQSLSEDDQDATLRPLQGLESSGARVIPAEQKSDRIGQKDKPSESSQEDIFLNLARADTTAQNAADTKQFVRNGKGPSPDQPSSPRQSISRSSFGPALSSERNPAESRTPSTRDHVSPHWARPDQSWYADPPTSSRYQSARNRPYAASAHPLDQRNKIHQFGLTPKASLLSSRKRSGSNREASPESPLAHLQRQSIPESSLGLPVRAYRQSNLSHAAPNGRYNSSSLADHSNSAPQDESTPETPRAGGTESTISTTAPSTVWDELDDLKSRIHKLELTGKLPPSSGAAISNAVGERPHTATTTTTTVSSSPKNDQGHRISSKATNLGGPDTTDIHPLLHSALAKSRSLINARLYRALEGTASDALTLAAMTGNSGSQATPQGTVDRQLRRKADSMCRSLTELCIALTAPQSQSEASPNTARPGSRDTSVIRQQRDNSVEEPRFLRGSSQEPDSRSSSSILDRLEARRTSMLAFNAAHTPRASSQDVESPDNKSFPNTTSRLGRSSTVLQRKRHADDDEILSNPTRPLSRANTEVNQHFRSSPRDRVSREYTSQYPLPSPMQQQRSPSIQSSIPSRRSYFSLSSAQSPSTPNIQAGNRRYLDRSTPNSMDRASLAEARQRRIASLGQYGLGGQGSKSRRVEGEVGL